MGGAIKLGAIVGGAYAAGNIGGGKLADALGVTNQSARAGVKVGTGIVVYILIVSVLG